MDFIQLFNSWYNKDNDKAEDVSTLISIFEKEGNATVNAVCDDKIAVLRQVTSALQKSSKRESFYNIG
jgi:uncharacterized protein Yka (UPF0111/DUF47 family)